MQTSFRSGILRHQTDLNNNPIFLRKVSGNVSIIVSPDPTIITFIDGNTDYIYSEFSTVTNAWNTAVDGAYLYWEMNRVTGLISYEATMLDPVIQSIAPSSPSTGQLWFDTINKYWFRFQGGWQRALVVFATKIVGVALTSMSDQAPVYRGTQVGINTRQSAGSLVYDLTGSAIQNSLGQFFTTEDDFVAGVPYGSSMRIEALATYAIANNSLAAYSVVRFNDFNQIVQATSSSQLVGTIGIVEEDAVVNDRIRVIYAGPITNENWDWTGYGIDAPIYVSNTGELSPSPGTGSQLPIARVIDKSTVLFEPWLGSQQVTSGSVTDHGLLSGLGNNDHPQYQLVVDAATELTNLIDVNVTNGVGIDDFVLTYDHGTQMWVAEASAGGGATPYDVVAQSIGVPTDGDTLTRMVFTRAVTVGSGSPVAHQGYAAIPPSGGAGTITVFKATAPLGGSPLGVSIGTLIFDNSSSLLSSETISGVSFAAGDMIYFEMTSGNSMGDLTVTLEATAD